MEHQILSRETVFKGHAFNVEKLQVRLPDGREREYDLVSHKDSVTIIPFDTDGNIWFVSQFRMGCECQLLELPAGVMDGGESPESCAAREVREETGFAAGKLTMLGSVYLAAGYSSEINHVFLAEDLVESPLAMDEDEFLNVHSFPVTKVWELVDKGEIMDSKSLAALLLAKNHLNP
ncbi:MAG TPA: NUDIX hydrolase [Pelolinea sp.]|nr:NUDIX hydrolase [Pelolinea sp.]